MIEPSAIEDLDGRVLVLAPVGRDAALSAMVLNQTGIAARICPAMEALCDEIDRGAAALLITEEALDGGMTARLRRSLDQQPSWSDIPLILLTNPGHETPLSLRRLEMFAPLGNVTVLERPVRVLSLVSAAQVALRARRRQYELRKQLRELRRAEDALRRSEESYRLLAEAMPQMVWTARPDGWVDYYNQRWFDYTGLTLADTQGAGWQQALHPDDRHAAIERWSAAVRSGEVYEIEYRFRRASDGSYRWHLGRALPLRDTSGRIVRWLGTCTDIDDQKRSEAQLTQARVEAETANRAKDEFLAMLSHELRSPLGAIRTWAHLLRTGKLDRARTVRAVESIERSAQTQAQIIEDLLDVSRINSGKLRLDVRRVDLADVVDAAIEIFRPTADAKTVTLDLTVRGRVRPVDGDPDRLQQVVANLISNAIKFTPAGGRVSVRLEDSGPNVRVVVSDTGQGISRAFLPHIFEHFRQADSAITRAHGGLGLGLAIVRYLVELHRGTVCAESAGEGAGATFTVTLAASTAEAARGEGQSDGRAARGFDSISALTGVAVLLVDDDPLALESLSTALDQYGARTLVATSAADALAILERNSPDVLVSDIAMPVEDGYSLIRRVRERERGRGVAIPAVALTAYAGGEDRDRALTAGFHAHIAKPFEPDRLVALLRTLVGHRAAS